MGEWYTTRERVKRSAGIVGDSLNDQIDDLIETKSREVDDLCARWFLPRTRTVSLDLTPHYVRGRSVELPADLLAVSSVKDRGGDRTLAEGTDFRLAGNGDDPAWPYQVLEMLRSSSKSWESAAASVDDAIEVVGDWGFSADTEAVGALTADPGAGGTTLALTRGDRVGVGDTLLVESERIFIEDRGDADLAVNLSGALTADETDTNLGLSGAPANAVRVGEVLRIGAERLRVLAVNSTTSFEVERAYDGTILAAHDNDADIFIERSFTVVRGVNGTTAAAHDSATSVSRYAVAQRIARLTLALVVIEFHQEKSGFARTLQRGDTDSESEFNATYVNRERKRVGERYRRRVMASYGR